MSCQALVELVTDYFEGRLSWRQRRRFEKHIAACHWCGRYLEQMQVTIRSVGRIDEASISPEAKESLLAAFKDWSGGGQPLREPQG
jgi:anti-sigma factor RsiW